MLFLYLQYLLLKLSNDGVGADDFVIFGKEEFLVVSNELCQLELHMFAFGADLIHYCNKIIVIQFKLLLLLSKPNRIY